MGDKSEINSLYQNNSMTPSKKQLQMVLQTTNISPTLLHSEPLQAAKRKTVDNSEFSVAYLNIELGEYNQCLESGQIT